MGFGEWKVGKSIKWHVPLLMASPNLSRFLHGMKGNESSDKYPKNGHLFSKLIKKQDTKRQNVCPNVCTSLE